MGNRMNSEDDAGDAPAIPPTLKSIRTEADYRAALTRIDALMDAEHGTPEGKELDILVDLVELYEVRQMPGFTRPAHPSRGTPRP
jgi:antitoxin component HigA of HigAB toxin-antitoxin module